ncbi:acyl-CoA N-acyltransferase [Violaceomyces palustris]|uniref:Acyl-CoA N-acyltransferase n=1 Tax=Violaceomyces palustris TaxID=1673888 RepID=A0ACD0P1T6_9BASI|nr:acyl-CoA N-acyltransferase [Violaceomyces palustris]
MDDVQVQLSKYPFPSPDLVRIEESDVVFKPPLYPLEIGVLRGERVQLVPLDPEIHARPLYSLFNTPKPLSDALYSSAQMIYGPFEDEQSFKSFLKGKTYLEDPSTIMFVVVESSTRSALGMISLLDTQLFNRKVEIGHLMFHPSTRGRRIPTEASLLLLDLCFGTGTNQGGLCGEKDFRRVQWKCGHLNSNSAAMALSLGMKFEGTLRSFMSFPDGRERDCMFFSLLESEWKQGGKRELVYNKVMESVHKERGDGPGC